MRKPFLFLTVLALALLLFAAAEKAQASLARNVEDASPQEVVDGMANKLARGVANVATGWLEFPKQIRETAREEGAVKAWTVGPLKGIGMTLVRTLSGAAEAGTFFIAYPGFFDPYFDPAYVWEQE